MISSRRLSWAVMLGAGCVFVACGGDDVPAAGTPADAAPIEPSGGAQASPDDSATAQETVLSREVFSYQGAGRDPFASLLRTGDVRPLLGDLRVTTINYDNQFPMNSVAVINDTTENERYAVRVGDHLGRLRVSSIRVREVVLSYEEFGRELQDTLRLSRNREGSQ